MKTTVHSIYLSLWYCCGKNIVSFFYIPATCSQIPMEGNNRVVAVAIASASVFMLTISTVLIVTAIIIAMGKSGGHVHIYIHSCARELHCRYMQVQVSTHTVKPRLFELELSEIQLSKLQLSQHFIILTLHIYSYVNKQP